MSSNVSRLEPGVVVEEDATTSSPFEVGSFTRGSVQLPTITGTSMNFQVSNDGENFVLVREDNGSEASALTVANGELRNIPPNVFKSKWCRILLASQTADRTLSVHLASP